MTFPVFEASLDSRDCCLIVIQVSRLELWFMRYELTDREWAAIKPMLPNKPRSVAGVDDRRVLNGISWVLRSGAPWRDLLQEFGPYSSRLRQSGCGCVLMSPRPGSTPGGR